MLVVRHNDQPIPKVIDFGVVKTMPQQLTEQILPTDFGAVVGTVEYMIAEWTGFNQADVDTGRRRSCCGT